MGAANGKALGASNAYDTWQDSELQGRTMEQLNGLWVQHMTGLRNPWSAAHHRHQKFREATHGKAHEVKRTCP